VPGRKQKFPTIPGKWNSAFFGNLHYNPHHQSRMFRHKNIRLPLDRYVGTAWFFVTFCCENRKKIFLEPTRAQWFLDDLRSDALSHALAIHAYCVMPDHVHLLSQGLTPTSDLFRCLTALKKRTGFTYKQETSHHHLAEEIVRSCPSIRRPARPRRLVHLDESRPCRSLPQRHRLPLVRLVDRRGTSFHATTRIVVSALAQPTRAHLKMAAT